MKRKEKGKKGGGEVRQEDPRPVWSQSRAKGGRTAAVMVMIEQQAAG